MSANNDPKSIPTVSTPEPRFTKARERSGLTVGQAAKLMGLNCSFLAEVEAGRAPAYEYLVARMVEVYRVNRPWLLGLVPELAPEEALRGAILCGGKATEADLREVRTFIASLAGRAVGSSEPRPVPNRDLTDEEPLEEDEPPEEHEPPVKTYRERCSLCGRLGLCHREHDGWGTWIMSVCTDGCSSAPAESLEVEVDHG